MLQKSGLRGSLEHRPVPERMTLSTLPDTCGPHPFIEVADVLHLGDQAASMISVSIPAGEHHSTQGSSLQHLKNIGYQESWKNPVNLRNIISDYQNKYKLHWLPIDAPMVYDQLRLMNVRGSLAAVHYYQS